MRNDERPLKGMLTYRLVSGKSASEVELLNQAQRNQFFLQLCSVDRLHQVRVASAQQRRGNVFRVRVDGGHNNFGAP